MVIPCISLHPLVLFPLINRQEQTGGVLPSVPNLLVSNTEFCISQVVAPRVVVAVMIGKITTGDLQANAVPQCETVGCRTELDLEFRHFAGRQEIFFIKRMAVPCANHAVADLKSGAIGMLIHQARKKSVSGAEEAA